MNNVNTTSTSTNNATKSSAASDSSSITGESFLDSTKSLPDSWLSFTSLQLFNGSSDILPHYNALRIIVGASKSHNLDFLVFPFRDFATCLD